jgi:hypothetical protein
VLDYQGGDRSNQLTVTGGVPSTTWAAWNFFLNKQTNFTDLPDYPTITGQPDTGQPMSFGQYWQLIGPWLTKNHGMSGLGWAGRQTWESWNARVAGLGGFVQSFPDRVTPRNRFYPNVRVWGF